MNDARRENKTALCFAISTIALICVGVAVGVVAFIEWVLS